MAYTKNTWVDQDVERPKTYEVTNNQDGSITLTDSFGLVQELGTPVNATNMNHIEDGIEDLDLLKADTDLSNLNDAGEKHFLNKTQITNCILEAPNGVLTSSGNTFTAKAGLKVLIPNGRNADGTLNNIEYTLENDVSLTVSSGGNNYIYSIYLNKDTDGVSYTIREPDCYTLPTKQYNGSRFIYNITENKFYWTPAGTPDWSERKYAIIGTYLYSNNSVTNLKSEQPINILKQSDKSEISGWGMPSNKYIDLTIGASGTKYTAPANGWVSFCVEGNADRNGMFGLNIQTTNYARISTFIPAPTKGITYRTFMPIMKNSEFSIEFYNSVTPKWLVFIYAQGSESEAS